MKELATVQNAYAAKVLTDVTLSEVDAEEEIFHMQADGFWGSEKGFQDAEEFRLQRQRQN